MNEFPNMSTSIICNYVKSKGLNGPPEAIQPHIHMLYMEARKVHPFLGACVKNVYNTAEWDFIRQYFK